VTIAGPGNVYYSNLAPLRLLQIVRSTIHCWRLDWISFNRRISVFLILQCSGLGCQTVRARVTSGFYCVRLYHTVMLHGVCLLANQARTITSLEGSKLKCTLPHTWISDTSAGAYVRANKIGLVSPGSYSCFLCLQFWSGDRVQSAPCSERTAASHGHQCNVSQESAVDSNRRVLN